MPHRQTLRLNGFTGPLDQLDGHITAHENLLEQQGRQRLPPALCRRV
jgi:hypothetical protein